MRVLRLEAKETTEQDIKTSAILREIARLESIFSYLLPRGWRAIIEMQATNELSPYYLLDVQADEGGGSYAEAKMNTLKTFSDLRATGEATMNHVNSFVHDLPAFTEGLPETIDELTKPQLEQLRDNGITPYHGGICIPYRELVVNKLDISEESGKICVAFSGASEEQDVFFALSLFKELQQQIILLFQHVQIGYDLSGFKKVPAVKFWIDLLGIRATPC